MTDPVASHGPVDAYAAPWEFLSLASIAMTDSTKISGKPFNWGRAVSPSSIEAPVLKLRFSLPFCISHLGMALDRFLPRMKVGVIDELRAEMLTNNEVVMKELAERDVAVG